MARPPEGRTPRRRHVVARFAGALALLVAAWTAAGPGGAGVRFGMPGAVRKVLREMPRERLTAPGTPSGLTAVEPGRDHVYQTGGAVSDRGDPVEYRFAFGDGTYSPWSASTSWLKSWTAVGVREVRAEARCAIHHPVTATSGILTVVVETVSAPGLPSGPTSVSTGAIYTYTSTGASTALNHPVEYRFEWGNSTFSTWTGTPGGSVSWASVGTKLVRLHARCLLHPSIATVSTTLAVTVSGPATGTIDTVAGTGAPGYNGDGMLATSAQLDSPYGPAVDAAGNLYIADSGSHRIRKVDAATGLISTVAGTGAPGYNGDGVPAASALLNTPAGVAVDAAGNLYIGDFNNHRVRKVDAATGLITTVAGTGTAGYNGDGIAATTARLNGPAGLAVDGAGDVWIADFNSDRVRKVDVSSGLITTVAGTGTFGYNGDGIAATSARLYWPADVAVDQAGHAYIADSFNHRVRKIDAVTGLISTVAGTGTFGYNGDNQAATAAHLDTPFGVDVTATTLYVADLSNNRVRKIVFASGLIETIAGIGTLGFNGDGIAATAAQLNQPIGVAVGASGEAYIADFGNERVRRVAP